MVTARKTFGSDNHAGVHPAVLAALSSVNRGDAVAYGDDPVTEQVTRRLREVSGARQALLVFNGTGANVVGLSLLLRPYEAVICAQSAHLNTDECGAAERLLGVKLLSVPTPDGKLTPELIRSRLGGRGDEHTVQPRVVAITQATEFGTCYTLAELAELAEFCRAEGLRIYMDGARLANAAAYLGCTISQLAQQTDVLSFGATKNGAIAAEAVLVMADGVGAQYRYQRKQLMQLGSKMRYLAAQFQALLEGDLWRDNADRANAMAQRLAERISGVPGVSVGYPVQANAVFAELGDHHIERLRGSWRFHTWEKRAGGRSLVRWMTAFDTTESDVDQFATAIRKTVSAPV